MPRSLRFDLRTRVLSAIDDGPSCRQAAARFGVSASSASSAIRWAAHADLIRAALAEVPDLTLEELKARLADRGATISVTALWRFCRRRAITRKKVGPRGRAGPSRRPAGARGVV